jgi:hypothetical protein
MDTRQGLPKIYGDNLTAEVTGKDGGPIQAEYSPLQVARRVAFLLTQGYSSSRKRKRRDGPLGQCTRGACW